MHQQARQYEFLEPWCCTDQLDVHFHETFLNELKTEVGPDHVMYDVPVRMIGRDGGSDDTLFEILDGSNRLALVHLTWAKGQERLPWPGTTIYPYFEAFTTERMIPQNQDYLEE